MNEPIPPELLPLFLHFQELITHDQQLLIKSEEAMAAIRPKLPEAIALAIEGFDLLEFLDFIFFKAEAEPFLLGNVEAELALLASMLFDIRACQMRMKGLLNRTQRIAKEKGITVPFMSSMGKLELRFFDLDISFSLDAQTTAENTRRWIIPRELIRVYEQVVTATIRDLTIDIAELLDPIKDEQVQVSPSKVNHIGNMYSAIIMSFRRTLTALKTSKREYTIFYSGNWAIRPVQTEAVIQMIERLLQT